MKIMFKLIYCIIVKVTWALLLGFAANETFREKCENFRLYSANFFAKFRIFSRKWMERKMQRQREISQKKNSRKFGILRKYFWWIFAKKKIHYFLNSDFFREIFTFLNTRKFLIFSRLIFSWLIDLLIIPV